VLDLLLPAGLPTPLDIRRAAFRREWLRLIDRVIDRRERLAVPDGQPRDLFDLLAASRDPQSGAGFSRAQLRDEISTMIIAGHETTAVTLFWACYVAARLPEQQARIAAEVAGLDLSADNAAAALKSLVWTRAFVDEVLRLYPPAFLIVRLARAADVICGRPIAAGTSINISPWVLHRHRRRWAAPQAFDPTRFLPDAPAVDRYAYLPFGAGPRICVGAQFALTEAVLVLARLIQSFELQLIGPDKVTPRGFVTTQPDRPVRFMIARRQGAHRLAA
jgi:cytochrome P450